MFVILTTYSVNTQLSIYYAQNQHSIETIAQLHASYLELILEMY